VTKLKTPRIRAKRGMRKPPALTRLAEVRVKSWKPA
jgi:hypothetical protein